MFWLMNAELVIGARSNEPELINAGLMEVMTGRERGPSTEQITIPRKHGSESCKKFWLDHVSDRFGRRDEIPPNTLTVPKIVFSSATDNNGQGGWME